MIKCLERTFIFSDDVATCRRTYSTHRPALIGDINDRNVFENIALPLKIAQSSKDEINAKTLDIMDAVGLRDKGRRYPDELSGGEQQRVAIARSLISNPEILIADEPTGNLDKKNSEDVIKLLFQLKQDFGSTLILVTHDTSVAQLCDRIIKLDNGLIVK